MEAHGEFLRAELNDPEKAAAIKQDYRKAPLDEPTRRLLEFSDQLTRSPHSCSEDTVDSLRKNGFSDEDIVDAVALVGMMNFLNRLADGLGIRLNEEYRKIGKDQVGGGQ